MPATRRKAFTLVELLVVIGIIALLVSILLPALTSARRAAVAIKCEAALREVYNASFMYASDNKGAAVPGRIWSTATASRYALDNGTDSGSSSCYWFQLLSKYVTKTKLGASTGSASERESARKSILWGCPAWEGYLSNGYTGGVNYGQTGYGVNAFPEYTASYPDAGISIGESGVPNTTAPTAVNNPLYSDAWKTQTGGKWYKMTNYTRPSERALFGDALFWVLEAWAPKAGGVIPGSQTLSNSTFWPAGDGQYNLTGYDFYRHGKNPPLASANRFSPNGGKVSFNICYADGHVANVTDRSEGYRAIRQRFPG